MTVFILPRNRPARLAQLIRTSITSIMRLRSYLGALSCRTALGDVPNLFHFHISHIFSHSSASPITQLPPQTLPGPSHQHIRRLVQLIGESERRGDRKYPTSALKLSFFRIFSWDDLSLTNMLSFFVSCNFAHLDISLYSPTSPAYS